MNGKKAQIKVELERNNTVRRNFDTILGILEQLLPTDYKQTFNNTAFLTINDSTIGFSAELPKDKKFIVIVNLGLIKSEVVETARTILHEIYHLHNGQTKGSNSTVEQEIEAEEFAVKYSNNFIVFFKEHVDRTTP
ncbi:MAG: hypothetical protein NTV15_00760 [Candidatus Bathyarchaeota archaeon]|nr:hypothetical protein [Candidatus Bathyarchaeota archaeon]